MKTNELMLGNQLTIGKGSDLEENVVIDEIFENAVSLKGREFTTYITTLEPIPISEELLIKNGFYKKVLFKKMIFLEKLWNMKKVFVISLWHFVKQILILIGLGMYILIIAICLLVAHVMYNISTKFKIWLIF